MSLKPSEIGKLRLINQQLTGTSFATGKEMVAWLGAVQGQEYAQSKWGLGLRLPHLKDDDIEQEFAKGNILRTHVLRPTWHLVTADDIRWLLELTAPRVNMANAYMYRKLELDTPIFNRCNDIIVKTLQGHQQFTRSELNAEFKKNKIFAEGLRLSYIMMRAELDGIICSGARRGNQFTYALMDERVPFSKTKSKEEALGELTRRYFASRGPATLKDFSTWSGLTLTDCKKGVEMVKSQLIRERVEDIDFFLSSDISFNTQPFQNFHLLPVYDEFIMGYKDRSAIMQLRNSMTSQAAFRFDNIIIFEGQIVGTWKRKMNKHSIDLVYDFFKPLDKKQFRLLEEAIHRFGEFTGLHINHSQNRVTDNT